MLWSFGRMLAAQFKDCFLRSFPFLGREQRKEFSIVGWRSCKKCQGLFFKGKHVTQLKLTTRDGVVDIFVLGLRIHFIDDPGFFRKHDMLKRLTFWLATV